MNKKQKDEIVINANTVGVPDTTENRQILLEYLSQVEETYNHLRMMDYESPWFALVLCPKKPTLVFAKLNDELLPGTMVLAEFYDFKITHLNKTWAEIRAERIKARA